MCLTTKENNWAEALKAMNISWHYSWSGRLNPNEPQNIQFVPMIWKAAGNFTDLDQNINYLEPLVKSQKVRYLLGFNEPDGEKQANMTVDEAIAAWPKLMELGVPLGSPACVHADNDWMKRFMTKATEQRYRVDFITVHWYGGPNVAEFIGYLKKIHKMYHKPIWITEFAVGDWSAKNVAENKFSPEEILAFMKNLLPELDKLSFVEKYAWFSAKPNSPQLGTSALFYSNGTLTSLGKYYSGY
ncbi:MAG: glycoside hydrolase family protein [Mucilaginibacter sp.]